MDLTHLHTFRAVTCDLNGQMRGKRLPSLVADKLEKGGVRLPYSVLNVDIWGCDIEDSPLVFETGDADGMALPTERGPVPMPWLDNPSAMVPMALYHDDGTPFEGDPRHALAGVLERYKARGWQVQAATEMEFYLVDDSGETPAPPVNPLSGRRLSSHAVLSMQQLDAYDGFFTELYDACAAMDIPAQSTISEAGLGQYEIDILHADAMRAALNAQGYQVFGGKNAPYVWLKTPEGVDSWTFFDKLLNEANVVGTPGAGFGAAGEGYFRLSAFNNLESVKEAMDRISKIQW